MHIQVTSLELAPLGQRLSQQVIMDRLRYHKCGSGTAIA